MAVEEYIYYSPTLKSIFVAISDEVLVGYAEIVPNDTIDLINEHTRDAISAKLSIRNQNLIFLKTGKIKSPEVNVPLLAQEYVQYQYEIVQCNKSEYIETLVANVGHVRRIQTDYEGFMQCSSGTGIGPCFGKTESAVGIYKPEGSFGDALNVGEVDTDKYGVIVLFGFAIYDKFLSATVLLDIYKNE